MTVPRAHIPPTSLIRELIKVNGSLSKAELDIINKAMNDAHVSLLNIIIRRCEETKDMILDISDYVNNEDDPTTSYETYADIDAIKTRKIPVVNLPERLVIRGGKR